jgi:chromosome segregation ATPase
MSAVAPVAAVFVLFSAGGMTHAAPVDDAKKSIASADKQVASNVATLKTLGRSLAQHITAIADVVQQLDAIRDRQRKAAPLIAQALEAANAGLAAAKDDAAAAQRALRDAEAALAATKSDIGPKRSAIERAASSLRKAFEASDEFKQASAKVEAANAAFARERSRLDGAMKADPTIGPLAAAAAKAEADLNTARSTTPPDDAAIAEASAQWIEAKNALSAAQADKYSNDSAFATAQKASDAAAAARNALSETFDKSILNQPGVAEAQLAFKEAQDAVKLCEANVAAARAALERSGRWLIVQRNNTDAIGRITFDMDRAIVAAEADLKRAQDNARSVGQDLAEAAAKVLGIRDDLKDATDALNKPAR